MTMIRRDNTGMKQKPGSRQYFVQAGIAAMLGVMVAGLWMIPTGYGQERPVIQLIRPLPANAQPAAESDNSGVGGLAASALDTNTDVDTLLSRAEEFIESGQYREAIIVLQQTAAGWPNVLTTQDNRTFYPVYREVERLVAKMPADGLKLYRLMADGDARALLDVDPAKSVNIDALQAVVDRYFMTSWGDDAAMRLASLMLDQGEYHRAASLLTRIIRDYPDPTVSQTEIVVRLAAAYALLGDSESAKDLLKQAEPILAGLTQARRNAITGAIAAIAGQRPGTEMTGGWSMLGGDASRLGVMNSLWEDAFTGKGRLWITAWAEKFDSKLPDRVKANSQLRNYAQQYGYGDIPRPQTARRWAQFGWIPAGNLAIVEGRLFHKSYDKIYARDLSSGRTLWEMHDNRVFPDSSGDTQIRVHSISGRRSGDEPDVPTGQEEVLHFEDDLGRGITVIDNVVYHIEGNYRSSMMSSSRLGMNVRFSVQDGTYGSRLAGWDASTGKLQFIVGPEIYIHPEQKSFHWNNPYPEEQQMMRENVIFRSLPISAGSLLALTVEVKGDIWMLGLNPKDGEIVWKTLIAGITDGEIGAIKPVGMTLSGGDIYLTPGNGIVVCIDEASGTVRWITLYERSVVEDANAQRNVWGRGSTTIVRGWRENTAYAVGRTLVVLPTDAQEILRFDRVTGQLLQGTRFPQGDYTYPIGVIDDQLLLAGPQFIRRIDLGEWKAGPARRVNEITGRPALTAEAVYVPKKDRIQRLDPMTLRPSGEVRVVTPADDPIGSIYIDGDRIYAAGMEWVYALVDGEREILRLTEMIEADPNAADLLARARLYRQAERTTDAIDDLRAARKIATVEISPEVDQSLFDILITEARQNPDTSGELLREAKPLARSDSEKTSFNLAWAQFNEANENIIEAANAYLALIEVGGNELVNLDKTSPGLRTLASRVGISHLQRLAVKHPEQISGLLEELAVPALALARTLPEAKRVDALEQVHHQYPGTQASIDAAWSTALLAREQGQWERGELILMNLAKSSHTRSAASGMAYLASYHSSTGWQQQARREWTTLAERFPEVEIIWEDEPIAAGELAQQFIVPLDREAVATTNLAYGEMPAAPWTRAWSERNGYSYPIIPLANQSESEFLSRHALIYQRGRHLMLKDLTSSNLKNVWTKNVSHKMNSSFLVNNDGVWYRGGRTGHVFVIATQDELHAYGLVSSEGNQLWSIDIPAPTGRPMHIHQYRNNMTQGLFDIDVDQGIAVVIVDDETYGPSIRAIDAITGKVVWARHFDQGVVDGVKFVGGHVAVILDNRSELITFDRMTGEQIGEMKLLGAQGNTRFFWTDDGLFYQAGRTANYYDLPSGEKRWERDYTGFARSFGKINSELAWWISPQNAVEIININDGRGYDYEKKNFVDSAGTQLGREGSDPRLHNVADVAITPDGRELYAIAMGSRGERVLGIFDLASGERRSTIDFGPNPGTIMNAETLARSGKIIPWVRRETDPKRNNRPTGKMEVVFYRKADGKQIESWSLPSEDNGKFQNMPTAPMIIGNTLFVMTHQYIEAFVMDPEASRDEAALKPEKRSEKYVDLDKLKPGQQPDPDKNDTPSKDDPMPAPRQGIQIRGGIQIQGGGAQRVEIRNGEIRINGEKVEVDPDNGPIRIINGRVIQGQAPAPAPNKEDIEEQLKQRIQEAREQAERARREAQPAEPEK